MLSPIVAPPAGTVCQTWDCDKPAVIDDYGLPLCDWCYGELYDRRAEGKPPVRLKGQPRADIAAVAL